MILEAHAFHAVHRPLDLAGVVLADIAASEATVSTSRGRGWLQAPVV
jgi:hypothetical protein